MSVNSTVEHSPQPLPDADVRSERKRAACVRAPVNWLGTKGGLVTPPSTNTKKKDIVNERRYSSLRL